MKNIRNIFYRSEKDNARKMLKANTLASMLISK